MRIEWGVYEEMDTEVAEYSAAESPSKAEDIRSM